MNDTFAWGDELNSPRLEHLWHKPANKMPPDDEHVLCWFECGLSNYAIGYHSEGGNWFVIHGEHSNDPHIDPKYWAELLEAPE